MMLGGRRAGKTSTLAAMQHCFDKVFEGTDLAISADSHRMDSSSQSALDVIEAKRQELERYVDQAARDTNFVPDSSPTPGDATYRFNLKLKGKPDAIQLDFYDFNGEWLVGGNSNYDLVQDGVKRSDVLLIIIDTPYLMEEDGTYNDVRNRFFRITQAIKENFDVRAEEGYLPKMVLFVPIKCERYYDDGRMIDVYNRIIDSERGYGGLINYLKGSCEIAVTPIQTIGTASFVGFDFDEENGNIYMAKEKDGKAFPDRPLYGFNGKAREAAKRQGLGRKYAAEPKYCEQPAIYILCYALTYAAYAAEIKSKESKKGIRRIFRPKIGEGILRFIKAAIPSPVWGLISEDAFNALIQQLRDKYDFTAAADFMAQRHLIYEHMIMQGEGYNIIDPDVLGLKKGFMKG